MRLYVIWLGYLLVSKGLASAQVPSNLWAEAAYACSLPLHARLIVSYLGVQGDDSLIWDRRLVIFERNKKFKLQRYRLETEDSTELFFLGNEFIKISKHKREKAHIATADGVIPPEEDESQLLYDPFFHHEAFFSTLADAVFRYHGKEKIMDYECDVLTITQFFPNQEILNERKVWIDTRSKFVIRFEEKNNIRGQISYQVGTLNFFEINNPKPNDFDLSAYDSYRDVDKDFGLQTGEPARDFQFFDLSDSLLRVSDFFGKVIVLDFWYSSCAPCRFSTPFLDEIYLKNKDRGLVILGINARDSDKKLIESFRQKYNVSYGLYRSSPKSLRLYKVSAFPTFVVIDTQGRISASFDGYSKATMKILEQTIAELLRK